MSDRKIKTHTDEDKDPIAQKYSHIGWGIFLILAGAVMILPHALVPEGFLWIAAGTILIVYRSAVTQRGGEASFGLLVAGVFFVGIGLSELIDFDIDIIPILLIIGGALLLSKAMGTKV